jgi:hypothetical protein
MAPVVPPWAAYLSADSAETRLRAGASLASTGCADKTLKSKFVRILPAAGDKTFTADSGTRCNKHHIQCCVKRFDDDCSKHMLKPSSLDNRYNVPRRNDEKTTHGDVSGCTAEADPPSLRQKRSSAAEQGRCRLSFIPHHLGSESEMPAKKFSKFRNSYDIITS